MRARLKSNAGYGQEMVKFGRLFTALHVPDATALIRLLPTGVTMASTTATVTTPMMMMYSNVSWARSSSKRGSLALRYDATIAIA